MLCELTSKTNQELFETKKFNKYPKTQTDSEIIDDYKDVKIKLRISFIFLEFVR